MSQSLWCWFWPAPSPQVQRSPILLTPIDPHPGHLQVLFSVKMAHSCWPHFPVSYPSSWHSGPSIAQPQFPFLATPHILSSGALGSDSSQSLILPHNLPVSAPSMTWPVFTLPPLPFLLRPCLRPSESESSSFPLAHCSLRGFPSGSVVENPPAV